MGPNIKTGALMVDKVKGQRLVAEKFMDAIRTGQGTPAQKEIAKQMLEIMKTLNGPTRRFVEYLGF